MKSRYITIPIVLAAVCLTGCEQRQDEALNLYKQIQREAQQRDESVKKQMDDMQSELKTIGETLADMQKQTGQGTAAAGPSADKIAEAVSEQVAKKVGEQNAAAFASMKTQIDELKMIAATRPVAAPAPPPVAVAPPQPAPTRSNPPVTRPIDMTDPGKPRSSDPTRKTFKIDFGDGR